METDKSNSFTISQGHSGHISGLDALRTLAIVGITLFHVFPNYVAGGYLGVSLFFVLTGFLLAYTSKRNYQNNKFTVAGYYLKRIKRIYPSLILVVFVSLGLFALVAPKVLGGIRPELASIFLGYNNWWQISQNADYFTRLTNTSPFTHLWFIGIELQYYLIWPVLFGLYIWIRKKAGERAGIAVIAAVAMASAVIMPVMYTPGGDVTRLYYGTDTRVYALLFGAVMGLAYSNARGRHIGRREYRTGPLPGLLFAIAIGVTIYAYIYLDGQNPLTYQGGMLVMTLLFCLMIAIAARSGQQFSDILENPALCWLGKKSYGIFLWQYPVLHMFRVQHWNTIPYYGIAEIIAIIVLAACTEYISDCLMRKQLPFTPAAAKQADTSGNGQSAKASGSVTYKLRETAVAVLMLVSLGLMVYGAYGTAMASATAKTDFQTNLKARMDANREVMKEQNEQAAKAVKEKQADADGPIDLHGITCIGDSVMLGSAGELRKVLPDCYIDAEVSRYVGDGVDIVRNLKAEGKLGKIVVIALGTNGPIAKVENYEAQTKELVKELGDDRKIFWVNVYCPDLYWHSINNDYIKKLSIEHANITIIDWCGMISQHTDWLTDDGVHPDTPGLEAYAKLVHDTIEWRLNFDKQHSSGQTNNK